MTFRRLEIFPSLADGGTLVTWELGPDVVVPENANLIVQVAVDNHSEADDTGWEDIATLGPSASQYTDTERRAWSRASRWWYRVKLVRGGAVDYSWTAPSHGGLDERSRATAREIARREWLRLTATPAGSPGLLLRRLRWGVVSTDPKIVDHDTGEVINPTAPSTVGTRFEGGYHDATPYHVEVTLGGEQISTGRSGTEAEVAANGRALAHPDPATGDLWWCCPTGRFYEIQAVQPIASMRSVPIVLQLTMRELERTNAAYTIDLSSYSAFEDCR